MPCKIAPLGDRNCVTIRLPCGEKTRHLRDEELMESFRMAVQRLFGLENKGIDTSILNNKQVEHLGSFLLETILDTPKEDSKVCKEMACSYIIEALRRGLKLFLFNYSGNLSKDKRHSTIVIFSSTSS